MQKSTLEQGTEMFELSAAFSLRYSSGSRCTHSPACSEMDPPWSLNQIWGWSWFSTKAALRERQLEELGKNSSGFLFIKCSHWLIFHWAERVPQSQRQLWFDFFLIMSKMFKSEVDAFDTPEEQTFSQQKESVSYQRMSAQLSLFPTKTNQNFACSTLHYCLINLTEINSGTL